MTDLPSLLDHRSVDWASVERISSVVHQQFRYDYPGPVHDLRQCLVVVPPDVHGDQRLTSHRIEVSAPEALVRCERDRFGNRRYLIEIPRVDAAVCFEVWLELDRASTVEPARCHPDELSGFLAASQLTQTDQALRAIAEETTASGARGLDLADAIMARVYGAIRYTADVTGVRTTAAQALAIGTGVCQDYAHVMLALCRLCGLPARYVSGHLLGEGGTHAWVEVLVADGDAEGGGHPIAVAFDPTHNRRAGPTYITVAVGRDYRDVAPTSGSFRAPYAGTLSARKRAGLVRLDLRDGEAA